MLKANNLAIFHKNKRLENLESMTISQRKDSPYLTLEVVDGEGDLGFYIVEKLEFSNNQFRVDILTVEEALKLNKTSSLSEKVVDLRDWQSKKS